MMEAATAALQQCQQQQQQQQQEQCPVNSSSGRSSSSSGSSTNSGREQGKGSRSIRRLMTEELQRATSGSNSEKQGQLQNSKTTEL